MGQARSEPAVHTASPQTAGRFGPFSMPVSLAVDLTLAPGWPRRCEPQCSAASRTARRHASAPTGHRGRQPASTVRRPHWCVLSVLLPDFGVSDVVPKGGGPHSVGGGLHYMATKVPFGLWKVKSRVPIPVLIRLMRRKSRLFSRLGSRPNRDSPISRNPGQSGSGKSRLF